MTYGNTARHLLLAISSTNGSFKELFECVLERSHKAIVNKNGVRLGDLGVSIGVIYRECTANTYYSERFSAPRAKCIESEDVSIRATCIRSHIYI